MTKRSHTCMFTALYAPRGQTEHAHQCTVCDDVIFVGDGKQCDREPKTHRKVGAK
jgi:hypothetical protein